MNTTLQKWKEDANEEIAIDLQLLSLHCRREIALIDLIEKKDKFIDRVRKLPCDPVDQDNCLACDAKDTLDLNEDLK